MFCLFLLGTLLMNVAVADDAAVPSSQPVSANKPVVPTNEVASGLEGTPNKERVVMARVGNEEITVDEFMHFLAKHPNYIKQASTVSGKAQLLRNAIENRLLILAMRAEGMIPKDKEGVDDDDLLPIAIKKLTDKHFPPPPIPDENTIRQYYEAHKQDFGIPASARVSQIQFRVPENAPEEEKAAAFARAQEAQKRIEAGEPFGDVAAEMSENPNGRRNKGDLGYLKRHVSEWFDRALDGLEVGQHTGILLFPGGYEILLLTDTQEAIVTPYPDAREAVVRTLTQEGQAKERANYVKSLAKRYGVSIELDELKGAYPGGVFP